MTGAERTPPGAGEQRPEVGSDASIDDIQADIERTRDQLGETVQALSDKVNVVDRARDTAREKAEAAKPLLAIAAGGLVIVAVVWWRRRRR
ncbi:DUF3618 domain-containing protein [Mycobacterium sp. 1423905.2]|uniref:DUF3618 domain-containing protein n=1 Tax=Mycobacterium sp. 1423905.2 TaxID=1856859 RepID=UPI0007FEFE5F|nr:DUF3618 domain-containing protein [Mycobacterium sp. 1423905.2]OBJ48054.1 hypothetical protein A9W95_05485 [Mycobacterium sp. 1423905.2]